MLKPGSRVTPVRELDDNLNDLRREFLQKAGLEVILTTMAEKAVGTGLYVVIRPRAELAVF